MVTINDVAKLAGVSNATASRALRRVGKIKPSTLKKVREAAKELGYIVNTSAQALKNYTRNKVGLIVSDISNDYYHHIQSSIQNVLKAMNYELTIAFSSENPVDEKESFSTLIGLGASYIFFTPTCHTNEEIINVALKNNIKVIQLFRNIYPQLPSIINDDEGGCYNATNYFISSGKKRILLLDVSYEYLQSQLVTPNRSNGFYKAINEHNITGKSVGFNVNQDQYHTNDVFKTIDEFKPDAIIAANANLGYIVLNYFKKYGTKIDLITYDDNKWFELFNISAIQQSLDELSNTIFNFVENNNNDVNSVVLNETIIIRK